MSRRIHTGQMISQAVPARFKGRVLVADDNDDLRDLMALRLSKLGVEPLLASNGAEAIAMAAREHPDLILLDMAMPVMDGYEAARKLRSAGFSGPIIAVTAHRNDEELQRRLAAGCDDSIDKPLQLEELRAVLAGRLPPAS